MGADGITLTILKRKWSTKKPSQATGLFFALASGLRQGAADSAERVADLGSEQTHDSNHNDGDEGENDRVLDEPLTFFLGCKQHMKPSFR